MKNQFQLEMLLTTNLVVRSDTNLIIPNFNIFLLCKLIYLYFNISNLIFPQPPNTFLYQNLESNKSERKCSKEMNAVIVIIYLFNFPDPRDIIIKTNLIRFLCMLEKNNDLVFLIGMPVRASRNEKERTDVGKNDEG